MTPQELIDLPYAGMAENELRKSKRWEDDLTVECLMGWMYDKRVMIINNDKIILEHTGEYDIHTCIESKFREIMEEHQ